MLVHIEQVLYIVSMYFQCTEGDGEEDFGLHLSVKQLDVHLEHTVQGFDQEIAAVALGTAGLVHYTWFAHTYCK